jgi:hypothetical protein
MMRRSLLALLLLGLTSSASAAWYPRLEKTGVLLEVGQSTTVEVYAVWTGIWLVPWTPWTFQSTNPRVASVTGEMPDSRKGLMVITAREPGRANAVISGLSDYYRVEVTVVCGNEDSVVAASPTLTATTGTPITLRAYTPHANRTTFAWYHGRTGDMSFPIGQSGPEIVYVTDDAGPHSVWVLATTSCSSSTAEFLIEARPPKRRPSRH